MTEIRGFLAIWYLVAVGQSGHTAGQCSSTDVQSCLWQLSAAATPQIVSLFPSETDACPSAHQSYLAEELYDMLGVGRAWPWE